MPRTNEPTGESELHPSGAAQRRAVLALAALLSVVSLQTPARAAPFPCDDQQFETDRAGFASGSLRSEQLVDVCGVVTQVLPARRTRSGTHGYFILKLPSGTQIEVISNLDAMASAPSGDPPPWPWVAVRSYVFVQGRYFYDAPDRQGIDWTEDDASRRWPHIGWVAVCDPAGARCTKYW